MEDEDYKRYVCVEPGCVNGMTTVEAQKELLLKQTIVVEELWIVCWIQRNEEFFFPDWVYCMQLGIRRVGKGAVQLSNGLLRRGRGATHPPLFPAFLFYRKYYPLAEGFSYSFGIKSCQFQLCRF